MKNGSRTPERALSSLNVPETTKDLSAYACGYFPRQHDHMFMFSASLAVLQEKDKAGKRLEPHRVRYSSFVQLCILSLELQSKMEHYGAASMRPKNRGKQMKQKTFTLTVGMVFVIVAALHVLRLVLGWQAVIGNWNVPLWISWLAIAVSGCLAYTAFTLGR